MREQLQDMLRDNPNISLWEAAHALSGKPEPAPPRPLTRNDCISGPRPCPWVGCRYHLFLDVAHTGTVRFAFGDDVSVLEKMPETCALDVADAGAMSGNGLAHILNITGTRVRFLTARAQQNFRAVAKDVVDELRSSDG